MKDINWWTGDITSSSRFTESSNIYGATRYYIVS